MNNIEIGTSNNEVRPEIEALLRRHNLSVDDLIKCGKGGLVATKEIKDRDGDIVDSVPDWNVRHKFFASFLELVGLLHGVGTTIKIGTSEEKKQADEAYKRWRTEE